MSLGRLLALIRNRVSPSLPLALSLLVIGPLAVWLMYGTTLWIILSVAPAVACGLISKRTQARRRASLHESPAFLQSLIDHLPVVVFVKRLTGPQQGRICLWNRTAEIVTGYSASRVTGAATADSIPATLAEVQHEYGQRMLADPMVIEDPELRFIRPDGELGFMHMINVPLFDQNDRPEYMLGIAQDITRSRKQSLALKTKQAELTAAYDASPLGLFRTDPTGSCTYVNRAWEKIAGLDAAAAMGNGWIKAIHPQDRIKVFRAWRAATLDSTDCALPTRTQQTSYRFLHADGRIVWASVKTAAIVVDGNVSGYTGTVDDVTARLESDAALADSEQRLRTIADTLPALVAYVDADQCFRFNNLAWEQKYGGSRDALRGQSLEDFFGYAHYQQIAPYVARVLEGEKITFELEWGPEETYLCIESTYIPQFGESSRTVIGFHMMLQDITARKLEQMHLRQLAELDGMTGLLNRGGFHKKLDAALEQSRAQQTLLAVMFLDLDHFKAVNDTHGHHTGDLLLKAFAGRLSQTLRSTDTIARIGGDEFTVVMEDLGRQEDAELIAMKIVQTVQRPFILESTSVTASVSIGLAFCQSGSMQGEALIKRADEMLYRAKHAGRNIFRMAPLEDQPG